MSVNVHTEVQLATTIESGPATLPTSRPVAMELEVPVRDESSTRIPLVGGQFALVDAIDAARLQHHKWQPVEIDGKTHARNASGRVMQRMILYGTGTVVHLNGDTLDNRRSNLRFKHQIVKAAPVRFAHLSEVRQNAPKVKRQPAALMTEDGTGVLVPLVHGIYALIDPSDWEAVSQHSWHYSGGYAKNGRVGSMHRFIMQPATGLVVDHINRDRLDNRRSNLRICTQTQNKSNVGMRPSNKSGYRGVFQKPNGGWYVRVNAGRDMLAVNKGPFETAEAAARVYDAIALEMRGEFAVLNFPTTPAPTSPRPRTDAETRKQRPQASNPRVGHATPPRFVRGGPTDRRILPAFVPSRRQNTDTASVSATSPDGDTGGEVRS